MSGCFNSKSDSIRLFQPGAYTVAILWFGIR